MAAGDPTFICHGERRRGGGGGGGGDCQSFERFSDNSVTVVESRFKFKFKVKMQNHFNFIVSAHVFVKVKGKTSYKKGCEKKL